MNYKEKITALLTIIRKEIKRFIRIWLQTLLPPVVTQTLYFIIFGKFIGTRIGNIQGISYMAFIVPGLVMMSVINSSYMNVVSSFFGSKFHRNVEELMVSPTPNWVIIAGYVIGGAIRGILVGLIVFSISIFFTRPVIYNFWIVSIFIILTAIVFALSGFTNAIFAKKFDDISIFPTFIITPLIYLGGIFYSIQNLPKFWQSVSKLNPILYMINGFRFGFHGFSDVNVITSIIILITFTVTLVSINLFLLKKGTGLKS
ncbi:MAG: ABC transporter permease [Spirochaetota bacterium]|nr:ABC transporter permease [Spirochaetota bacterium]